jgi:hypothetical protein
MGGKAESEDPGPGVDGYVQDGIIFWLDGIWNTQAGHKSTATVWEDLSGNGHNYTYRSDSVITPTYCIPNGRMASTIDAPSISTSYTIEVVTDIQESSTGQFILALGNGYGTIFVSATVPVLFFHASKNTNGAHGFAIQEGRTTYTAQNSTNYFINGAATTRLDNKTSWSATNLKKYLFYYNSSYPYSYVSPVYAIRIYNRTLTEAEIAQNYAQDVARFGGGS